MKIFYPIQVIDLRFQSDYITPKKVGLFEKFETAYERTTLYVISIKHKEVRMVSDGKNNDWKGTYLRYYSLIKFT